jgi:hypothetical protein
MIHYFKDDFKYLQPQYYPYLEVLAKETDEFQAIVEFLGLLEDVSKQTLEQLENILERIGIPLSTIWNHLAPDQQEVLKNIGHKNTTKHFERVSRIFSDIPHLDFMTQILELKQPANAIFDLHLGDKSIRK